MTEEAARLRERLEFAWRESDRAAFALIRMWGRATRAEAEVVRLRGLLDGLGVTPDVELAVRRQAADRLLAVGRDPQQNMAWFYPDQAAAVVLGEPPRPH